MRGTPRACSSKTRRTWRLERQTAQRRYGCRTQAWKFTTGGRLGPAASSPGNIAKASAKARYKAAPRSGLWTMRHESLVTDAHQSLPKSVARQTDNPNSLLPPYLHAQLNSVHQCTGSTLHAYCCRRDIPPGHAPLRPHPTCHKMRQRNVLKAHQAVAHLQACGTVYAGLALPL